jgi:hypothetical protein
LPGRQLEEAGNGGLSAAMQADDVCFPSEVLRGGRWFEDGLGSKASRERTRTAALRQRDAARLSGRHCAAIERAECVERVEC